MKTVRFHIEPTDTSLRRAVEQELCKSISSASFPDSGAMVEDQRIRRWGISAFGFNKAGREAFMQDSLALAAEWSAQLSWMTSCR